MILFWLQGLMDNPGSVLSDSQVGVKAPGLLPEEMAPSPEHPSSTDLPFYLKYNDQSSCTF